MPQSKENPDAQPISSSIVMETPAFLQPLETAIIRFFHGTIHEPHRNTLLLWTHPANGPLVPRNARCSWFGTEKSVFAFPKLDFFRGSDIDDFGNGTYAKMLVAMRRLCDPIRGLACCVSPASLHSHGSWMECVLGAAYTLRMESKNLGQRGA